MFVGFKSTLSPPGCMSLSKHLSDKVRVSTLPFTRYGLSVFKGYIHFNSNIHNAHKVVPIYINIIAINQHRLPIN